MAAPMFRHVTCIFNCISSKATQVGIRHFSKTCSSFASRRPLAIYTPEEADGLRKGRRKVQFEYSSSLARKGRLREKNGSLYPQDDNIPGHDGAVQSGTGEPYVIPADIQFETLPDGDKRFGPVIQSSKNRKNREKKNVILLEGRHLVLDAITAGAQIKSLFFVSGKNLEGFPLHNLVRDETTLYKVKMRHMELWSDLTHPTGIMAICRMPRSGECLYGRESPLPITLVCDGIRDQGYMGTLIRTAAGVGCDKVLLTKGCVDIWDPKVLRSATGAHFRVPLLPNISWELISNYVDASCRYYLADCRSDKAIASEMTSPLNRKEKSKLMQQENTVIEEVFAENDETLSVDDSYLDEGLLDVYKKVQLPVTNYCDVDFTQGGIVIVVSGETGEMSPRANKLVYDRHGEQVFVPLTAGVDRLNPAVTSSLVMFEAKRQLLSKGNMT